MQDNIQIAVKYSPTGNSSWAALDDIIKPMLEQIKAAHAGQMTEVLTANKQLANELKRAKIELENYITMRWSNAYNVLKNAEGYIVDIKPLDTVIDTSITFPIDATAGYYKIINGKITLDEYRKAEMLTVV